MRAAFLLIGCLFLPGGILLLLRGVFGAGLWLTLLGVMLLVGFAIERWRYKPLDSRSPGIGWNATSERFIDPATGKLVTVYYNPATGERRYVAPGAPPPGSG